MHDQEQVDQLTTQLNKKRTEYIEQKINRNPTFYKHQRNMKLKNALKNHFFLKTKKLSIKIYTLTINILLLTQSFISFINH